MPFPGLPAPAQPCVDLWHCPVLVCPPVLRGARGIHCCLHRRLRVRAPHPLPRLRRLPRLLLPHRLGQCKPCPCCFTLSCARWGNTPTAATAVSRCARFPLRPEGVAHVAIKPTQSSSRAPPPPVLPLFCARRVLGLQALIFTGKTIGSACCYIAARNFLGPERKASLMVGGNRRAVSCPPSPSTHLFVLRPPIVFIILASRSPAAPHAWRVGCRCEP